MRSEKSSRGRAMRSGAALLVALVVWPVCAEASTPRPLSWERLARKKPGSPVLVVLAGGQRVEGRVLEAGPDEAVIVDFTGRALSLDAEKRVVRKLRQARRTERASANAGEPQREAAAFTLLHVTRGDGTVVFEQPGGPGLGALLKIVVVAVGAYLLALAVALAIHGPFLD